MKSIFISALNNFKSINNDLPDLIMLYRDGVGSQISESIENEVFQIKQAINEVGGTQYIPEIVINYVNKRINQRFFA